MYDSEARYLLRYLNIDLDVHQETSPISFRRILPHFPIKYRAMLLDDGIDGIFIRSKKGNHITINSSKPYTRRRFSLGHEFGHFYLNHDSDVTTVHDQNRLVEVQANQFSASLLAPSQLVYALSKEKESISEMAAWLRISPISMAIRCMQLGIRKLEAEWVKSDYYWQLGDAQAMSD